MEGREGDAAEMKEKRCFGSCDCSMSSVPFNSSKLSKLRYDDVLQVKVQDSRGNRPSQYDGPGDHRSDRLIAPLDAVHVEQR